MKKRVLFVIDQIKTGGAEKILLEYNEYLLSHGYETKIFVLYDNDGKYDYGCKKNDSNVIIKGFQQIRLYWKLKSVIKKYKPDVLFSFLERSNILVSWISSAAVKIATVHNILSIQYKKLNPILFRVIKGVIRKSYSRVPQLIVVSESIKSDLVETYNLSGDNIIVITNKTDPCKIIIDSEKSVTEFEWDNGSKYIINIGRFCHQKAQWKVFDTIAYLKTNYPGLNIKGIIMGDGELKSDLHKYRAKLNLENDVIIMPYQKNPYKFIKRSDIFLLPSYFEGCPIVLSEVIALGIPFVGSKPAVPIDYFNGDLVAWEDVTFDIKNFSDFECGSKSESQEIGEKVIKQLSSLTSVSGTRKWNESNYKEKQFDEYTEIFED